MKNLIFLLILVFSAPSFLLADEVDSGLPSSTADHIKDSARMVIRIGVESQGVIKMTRIMIENKYKEQQILEAHQILMNARTQNLPESPVLNKLYECIAKKTKPDNTIMAMETVRSNYETASEYAGMITGGKDQSKSMTEEIAQCMGAGIGNIDMKRMTELIRKKIKEMKTEEAQSYSKGTLTTVKIMARAGAESGSVTDVVANAIQRGYTAKDMEKLGDIFTKQKNGAASSSALADSFADAIMNGATVDNVASYSPASSGNVSEQ
jgi:hypothetical protein